MQEGAERVHRGDEMARGIAIRATVANQARSVGPLPASSIESASTRIPAVDHLKDLVVGDRLIAIRGGKTLVDFTQEPLVIVHHSFHGLFNERLSRAALLCGHTGEFGLQIAIEVDFHAVSLGPWPPAYRS
jgi:hypothetical protein